MSKWFHFKYYKIEQKLLITYPLLIIVSISVVSAFAIYFSKQHLKDRSMIYANSILKQISYNIDSQLSRIDQDSYIFYNNRDVKDFLTSKTKGQGQEYYSLRTRIQEFLTSFLLTHPDIESVYLINPEDDVITSVDSLHLENLPEYRKKADIGDGKIVWLNTEMNKMGNRVVPFVRDINDLSTNKTNGVLLVNYLVSAINTEHAIGISGSMAVLDQTGMVITSDNPEEIGKKMKQTIVNRLTKPADDFFMSEQDGRAFYIDYKSNFTYWTYLYRIPEEALYKGIDSLRNLVIVVAALFGTAAVIFARIIAYNISRPIHRIIKEMRNIERNDLLVNLNYDGTDELFYLSSSFNHMMNRLRKLIQSESELQRMQHELEMRALQAEINPHFLYNTLDAINWMGRMNRIPEICDMTTMLADILRYSISSQREFVTLREEFEHVKKYIGIQQLRYKDKLTVFYDIPEEMMNGSIPKLTFQPIVENAIIHGLEQKLGGGRIQIVGYPEGQRIRVKIEDNGCGMSSETIDRLLSTERSANDSVGLHNVNQRLKILFGEPYGIEIESVLGKGTRVILTLPAWKETD